ncbi:helix-hairpin-helix domain-containing protein [Candidatus Leptofilum sp.]|uniref:ComEA family DNA-binding protein n=1 Tax=Candidatus Leptofilum sp. TaxID=3241576 RepID=UPI003B5CB84B
MSEKIDINVADAETLAMISGIGPALAQRIIEYRETVHPFEEVIELAAVPGISEKMVRSFEDLVTVQPDLQETAVPPTLDAPEEHLLLDAPEAMEMLDAPPQPDGLLAAEVPVPAEPENVPSAVEEDSVDESEAVDEAEDAAEPVIVEEVVEAKEFAEVEEPDETEPLLEARDIIEDASEPSVIVEEVVEGTEDELETAVAPPPTPEIENLPLADPDGEAIPEPDLMRAMPPTQNDNWEASAQRRGCITTLLGATFGAILGAVLTLAVLAALNQGSLNYAATDSQIQQRLDTEIISRTNELNQLSTRVSIVTTREAASNQTLQDEFTAANDALTEEIADNEEIISYLATRSGDLELRLQEVAGAADTFTSFLDGLRSLLGDLEGGNATPTPAPSGETPTPTPTPFGTNTPTAEAPATTAVSPTGDPTRTPQPTATQFSFPTNTPAPQP